MTTGVEAWACVLEQACSDGLPKATPTEARVPRLLLGIGRVPEVLRRLRPWPWCRPLSGPERSMP